MTLTGFTPAHDGVALTANLLLNFSAPVDAGTVNNSTITLSSQHGAESVVLTVSGAQVTVDPVDRLEPSTVYTITVNANVHGTANESLGGDVTQTFTTGSGWWATASKIDSEDLGDADAPQLQLDGQGNAFALWSQDDGTRSNLWTNRYTAGAPAWSNTGASIIVPDTSGTPGFSLNSKGQAMIVWSQSDGNFYNIYSARFDGKWSATTLVENSDIGNAFGPQVIVDADGNALAIWYQLVDVQLGELWASRYTAGGWSAAGKISGQGGDVGQQFLKADANGNVLVVWEQSDGTNYHIWANRYATASGWGTATQISTGVGDAWLPDAPIEFDATGNAIVVWEQNDSVQYKVWANRYAVGGGWGAPTKIDNQTAADSSSTRLQVGADGTALIVWEQQEGTAYGLWVNQFIPGTGWSTAAKLAGNLSAHTSIGQIAMDRSSNGLVVWEQFDGTRADIWANRYAGGAWATVTKLSTEDLGDAHLPQVKFDANGNALVLWYQWDGTYMSVWAIRSAAGAAWEAPVKIDGTDSGDAYIYENQFAFDADGNALAVWEQSDGANSNIWANRYTAGGGWGTAVKIDSESQGTAYSPQLRIDAAGNALAVWRHFDGVRTNLWANHYGD